MPMSVQYMCTSRTASVCVCGSNIDVCVCVPVCSSCQAWNLLPPLSPVSPQHKAKAGLFIVLPALFFFWLLSKFPLSLLLGSSIHSTALCYYLLPVVFTVEMSVIKRPVEKGSIVKRAKYNLDWLDESLLFICRCFLQVTVMTQTEWHVFGKPLSAQEGVSIMSSWISRV